MYSKRYLFTETQFIRYLVLIFIGTVATFFFLIPESHAATCTYTGPASGDWHTPGNWSCASVPGSSDSAILPPAATVSGTTAIVNPGDLTVGVGAILDVDGQNLTVASGTTTNAGSIQVTGVMSFQAVDNSGAILENGIGSVNFNGPVTNTGSIATTLAGSTARFSDTWNNVGGSFDSDFLLTFDGSVAQLIPSNVTSVNALRIEKTGSSLLTLQGNLELTDGSSGLVMTGGGTKIFDLGGFTITNDSNTFSINTGSTIRNGTQLLTPSLGSASIYFDNGVTTNINMSVSSTGDITLTPTPADGIFDLNGDLTVSTGTIAFATAGQLYVRGATVINTAGTINNDGVLIFYTTTTNLGTLGNGGASNVAILDGPFTNTGAINIGTSYLEFQGASTWNNAGGTINADAKVEVFVNSDMTFPGEILINYLNISAVGATTRVTFGGNVTSTNYTLLQGGILDLNGYTLYTKQLSDLAGSLDPTTGTVEIIGSGSSQRLSNVTSVYDLRINTTAGGDIATLSGDTEIGNQLRILNGVLALSSIVSSSITFSGSGTGGAAPFQAGSSEFIPAGGTVNYTGSATTDIQRLNYYGLQATGAATYNLTASTTAMGPVVVGAGSTLAVGASTFTVLGTITNLGLMTVGAGVIQHSAESVAFTDSVGGAVTTVYPGGNLYARVQDSDHNMDGTVVETMSVTVSAPGSMGGDIETMTLTETGVATGIFTSLTPMNVQIFDRGIVGDGLFEYSADGNATLTYTDPEDGTDVATDIVALTTTPATVTPGVSGGGGGGGIPSPFTTFQSYTSGVDVNTTGIPTHSLVKLMDDGDPLTQSDTAVYYIGTDGKRHAFTNEKVYFSWYPSFDGIQILSGTQMAGIPLGVNITYKPGTRMVKFLTDLKVYAVDQGGVLRWIVSEALATQLYGWNWNQKIDDISDAFYGDYRFGTDIASIADFDIASVMAGEQHPSDSF